MQRQQPIVVDGVQIVDDEAFMFCQLEQRAAAKGTDEPTDAFFPLLQADYDAARAFARDFEAQPTRWGDRTPRSVDELDTESHVIVLMPGLLASLYREKTGFVEEFEENAKKFGEESLARSESEERSAAFRYGIDWTTISTQIADCLFGDCTREVTNYSMREDASPDVKDLQAAATILLTHRQALDQAKEAVNEASQAYADAVDNANEVEFAHKYYAAETAYKDKIDQYDLILGYLGQTHPILKALGDREQSASDLEKLTQQKAGPEMAALLGEEIVSRLGNIVKVREGLKDREQINIWRLPHLVGIAGAQMGVDVDPLKKRWVDETVKAEKPGWLEDIALLVFNLGALLLAAPTGGASLAVAAGVNAAVAVQHVKDYVLQQALTGTSFDKAQALSQDEPSLFWLAVDIVGVAFDAAAAFKALSETVKAVKIAKEAKDAARVTSEMEKLEAAARHFGGEDLAQKVVAHLGGQVTEERAALKALGLAEEEVKTLRGGAELAEKELEAGTLSGKAAAGSAKVSRLGHIFSCSWPCKWMREKYDALFGSDVHLAGEATSLRQQFLAVEADAAKAAEEVRIAEGNVGLVKSSERAAPADRLARAKDAAEAVEKKVAAFDQKLARELSYRGAMDKLVQLSPDEAFKLVHLNPDAVIRVAGLEPEAAKRLLQLAPDAFFKVTELSPHSLKNIAQLEQSAIEMFAQLEKEALTYVADLHPRALEWLATLPSDAVRRLASARITSRFSLSQFAKKIRASSSTKEIEKEIARAERHEGQLRKAFEAVETGDWDKLAERTSIGKHIGYEVEEIARELGEDLGMQTRHYVNVTAESIDELRKTGGSVIVTQGRLTVQKGRGLRFDIAKVNFDKKTAELIDLVPSASPVHVTKTLDYERELRKLLPDFTFITSEKRYVGAGGQVLEELEEAVLKE